jgi:hypothetical protein
MYTIRAASVSDLPAIYRLQNTPYREKILTSPLNPYNQFFSDTSKKLEEKEKHLFLLEADGAMEGFIDFEKSNESWHPTFWSRWLNTLVYGCCEAAFRFLGFPKINWYVRQNNQRMHRICERYHFRKTGEESFCNITEGFDFVALGRLTFFELTSAEYLEREDSIRQQSLPVTFR